MRYIKYNLISKKEDYMVDNYIEHLANIAVTKFGVALDQALSVFTLASQSESSPHPGSLWLTCVDSNYVMSAY